MPQGCGTLYKLPAAGGETVVYAFTGTGGDGSNVEAGLIRDKAGNLYGTTSGGGGNGCTGSGCGTVFRLDTAGKETVLHRFKNGTGIWPPSKLIWYTRRSQVFGVTFETKQGGGGGTVYELMP